MSAPAEDPKKNRTRVLRDFMISFLMPTIVGKTLVLYFGQHYADQPGAGYGYGLAAAICFTCFMLGKFVWKYRNYEDV